MDADPDALAGVSQAWSGRRSARCRFRLTDLEEFIHRPLTTDVTEPASNCYLLTVACPCGVVFERWVTPLDPGLDLLQSASLN